MRRLPTPVSYTHLDVYKRQPFSTGEAKAQRGVGRREIGHGHLAWRASVSYTHLDVYKRQIIGYMNITRKKGKILIVNIPIGDYIYTCLLYTSFPRFFISYPDPHLK